jgi:hypothetical protein
MRRLNVPGITTTGTAQNPLKVPQRPNVSPYTPPPAPAPDPNRPITTSGASVPGAGMSYAQTPGTNTTYGGTSTYGAGSNLINAQFNPQASGRTTGAQGMTDTAAQRFAGMPLGGTGNYGGVNALLGQAQSQVGAPIGGSVAWDYGADTNKVRGMTMQSLEQAMQGPDRAGLAADAYKLMEERSRPEFDQRVRGLGQQTAALGRIGSGIYGSNLTDLNAERERELGLNRRELANSAAGQSLQDRLAQLDASRGIGESFAGMDQNKGNIEASRLGAMAQGQGNAFGQNLELARFMYGMERDKDTTAYDRSRDQFTTLGDYARGLGGDDRLDREELRGERGFQYGANRDAVGDRFRSYELDQQGQRDRYGMMKDLGYGKDPNAARQYVSGQAGASAAQNFGGGGDLLGEYMYRKSGATDPRVRLPSSIYGEPDRINDVVNGGRY